MGLFDKMRSKSEREVTDATIAALAVLDPTLRPRGLMTMCPEGHAHYSAATNWGSDVALFVRCHPTTYLQVVSEDVAAVLFEKQHAGASMEYLTQHTRPNFSKPFAAANLQPSALAAEVASRAPRRSPPTSSTDARASFTAHDIHDMDGLADLLDALLPSMSIERYGTPGSLECYVEFSLSDEQSVRATPRPSGWTLSLRGIGREGIFMREQWQPRDSLLDSLAMRLVEMLTIVGAARVRGSRAGLEIDARVRNPSEYERDFTRLVLVLSFMATDTLPFSASDTRPTAPEIAGDAIVKLFEKRPDIQEAMIATFPGSGSD